MGLSLFFGKWHSISIKYYRLLSGINVNFKYLSVDLYHIVNSVIESSLQEIIGRKNFALVNLSWNFTEVIIKANKVIRENLVTVINFKIYCTSINQWSNQSQPSKHPTVIGCSIGLQKWIKFSGMTLFIFIVTSVKLHHKLFSAYNFCSLWNLYNNYLLFNCLYDIAGQNETFAMVI